MTLLTIAIPGLAPDHTEGPLSGPNTLSQAARERKKDTAIDMHTHTHTHTHSYEDGRTINSE